MNPTESSADLSSLLEPVTRLAHAAGEKILEIYESDFAIEQKEDRSPLTEADLASHHAILAGLNELTPGVPILSEESSSRMHSVHYGSATGWSILWTEPGNLSSAMASSPSILH